MILVESHQVQIVLRCGNVFRQFIKLNSLHACSELKRMGRC